MHFAKKIESDRIILDLWGGSHIYYKSNKAANLGRKFDENWREKIK
jgi:hypothetical protein